MNERSTASEHYRPVVLLDLDGTLVDSVYQHVTAWDRALSGAGYTVPRWRIHAAIGMGSDRLLPWVLGEHPANAAKISEAHTAHFLEQAETLHPMAGALSLLDDFERRSVPFRIATSANPREREALLAALGLDDVPYTDAGDVDEPKPAPDLLLATCRELNASPGAATMVGDSPWDAEAAHQVGIRTILLRCGGFGDDRLFGSGAFDVVDEPGQLVGRL